MRDISGSASARPPWRGAPPAVAGRRRRCAFVRNIAFSPPRYALLRNTTFSLFASRRRRPATSGCVGSTAERRRRTPSLGTGRGGSMGTPGGSTGTRRGRSTERAGRVDGNGHGAERARQRWWVGSSVSKQTTSMTRRSRSRGVYSSRHRRLPPRFALLRPATRTRSSPRGAGPTRWGSRQASAVTRSPNPSCLASR